MLIRQTTPGALPPFIVSLLPEGWLETVLGNEDERTILRSGKRYMSNIAIVELKNELKEIAPDTQIRPLSDFTKDGVFTAGTTDPLGARLKQASKGTWRNFMRLLTRRDYLASRSRPQCI